MSTLAIEIQDKLRRGIVTFTFRKRSGELRMAKGTLAEEILVSKGAVVKNPGTASPNVQVFFDLEKNDFRSFTIGTECAIIGFEEI